MQSMAPTIVSQPHFKHIQDCSSQLKVAEQSKQMLILSSRSPDNNLISKSIPFHRVLNRFNSIEFLGELLIFESRKSFYFDIEKDGTKCNW